MYAVSSIKFPMFYSKSVISMNTSLMRERLSISNRENHSIQTKVLKELSGFLLWAQQEDFMLARYLVDFSTTFILAML
jgi:hypothetical protein